MKFKPLVLVLLLAACAASLEAQVMQSCNAWGSALFVLSDARSAGKLSSDDVAAVNRLVPIATSICNSDSPTEIDLNTLRRAVRQANRIGAL